MKPELRTIGYKGDYVSASLAHPAADALPWSLHDGDFAALIEDMRLNGFDPTKRIIRGSETGRIIDGSRREVELTNEGHMVPAKVFAPLVLGERRRRGEKTPITPAGAK